MPKFDELTGLRAGENLERRLEGLMDRADESGEPLSVILADLGGLKLINEAYGRSAGDLVLRSVATTMRMSVEDPDLCYRLGGDAFVIILPNVDAARAAWTAERLRDTIRDTPVVMEDGIKIPLTAFSGAATYPGDAQTAKALVRAADRRMHVARGLTRAPDPDA